MGKALRVCVLLLALLSLVGCDAVGRLLLLTPAPTVAVASSEVPTVETPIASPVAAEGATIAAVGTPLAGGTAEASKAVTPELGRVAYVLHGDIYIEALPDGEPIRVTTDGRNQGPRWAPSGAWLAYQKDTQLWVVAADGAEPWAVEDAGPVTEYAWSVGDELAYVAGSGVLRLGVVGMDRAIRTLAQSDLRGAGTVGQVRGLVWSPDGASIAFGFGDVSASSAYQGLWRVSAEDGKAAEVYAGGKGQVVPAAWTSDRQYIAFWQGEELSASLMADGVPVYAVPIAGGEPKRLFDAVLVRPGYVLPDPARSARVLGLVGEGREGRSPRRLELATAGAGESSALDVPGYSAGAPAWSPDGRRLIFARCPDGSSSIEPVDLERILTYRRIGRLTPLPGGQLDALTADTSFRDERPLWSADAGTLLIARLDSAMAASLWLLDAAGGAPQQVVSEFGPITDNVLLYDEVNWAALYDWWPGTAQVQVAEETGAGLPVQTVEPASDGWNRYTFSIQGASLTLPADWETLRLDRTVYAGPAPVRPEIGGWQVAMEVAEDIPADTTGLAEGVIRHWIGLGATAFRTAYVRVGGASGVALWGLPDRGIEYYAVAHGAVRHLALSPDLGQGLPGAPKLTTTGRQIVNSVQWLGTDGLVSEPEAVPTHESGTVQVFLIAIYDQGESGKPIGCSDSLVPITRPMQDPSDPLRSALEELLSLGERFVGEAGLYNALYQSELRVESATLVDGVATIDLAGTVRTGGACDTPRFESQLLETVLQFPEVEQVEMRINGVPLQDFLSEQGQ
ncbi:MAG: GerMN domain-containing protein [Anaerolineae bacterium]